jgi:hypothetical protein
VSGAAERSFRGDREMRGGIDFTPLVFDREALCKVGVQMDRALTVPVGLGQLNQDFKSWWERKHRNGTIELLQDLTLVEGTLGLPSGPITISSDAPCAAVLECFGKADGPLTLQEVVGVVRDRWAVCKYIGKLMKLGVNTRLTETDVLAETDTFELNTGFRLWGGVGRLVIPPIFKERKAYSRAAEANAAQTKAWTLKARLVKMLKANGRMLLSKLQVEIVADCARWFPVKQKMLDAALRDLEDGGYFDRDDKTDPQHPELIYNAA